MLKEANKNWNNIRFRWKKITLNRVLWGQWIYWKQIELVSESNGLIGSLDSKVILKNIEENGYSINEVTINFTENDSKL